MNRFRRTAVAVGTMAVLVVSVVVVEAHAGAPASAPAARKASAVSVLRPDHVVVVMLENKRYDSVVGHPRAPWVSSLARTSANMVNFYGEAHPSQPNYLALFSGSTQGVADNNCPHALGSRPNLARQLIDAGRTFIGYSEDLPSAGWKGCAKKGYVRRHNPWVNFSNVPTSVSQPYTAFPKDYRALPTVSFVIPNLCHDMHDCPKPEADAWLRKEFAPYLAWARTHNSLLIVTFDEDNKTGNNHIPTIIAGARVKPGQYTTRLDHYDLLHTLQQMYGLPPTGAAARRQGMPDIRTGA